jgi:hypothetical protein
MLDTKDTGDEIARRQDALRTLLDAALPREVLPEPGESALHYGHFLAYVAMGLHRGLYPLADARQIDRRWVERLSSRHHWRSRSRAWDDALQRKELREMFLRAVDAITREERQAA